MQLVAVCNGLPFAQIPGRGTARVPKAGFSARNACDDRYDWIIAEWLGCPERDGPTNPESHGHQLHAVGRVRESGALR